MFINKTFYKQSYLKNIYNFDEIAILDNIVEFWTVTEGKKKKKSKRIYERWKYKESLKENNGGGMMSSIPQPNISQKKKSTWLMCIHITQPQYITFPTTALEMTIMWNFHAAVFPGN